MRLTERLSCVRRGWTPLRRLHPGNVAWAAAGGDGRPPPDAVLAWGSPLWGFADVWRSAETAEAVVHIAPDATPAQRAAAIDELLRVAPRVTVDVSRQERALVDALIDRGFHEADGPWYAQLWRDLSDVSGLAACPVAAGYTIRPVGPADLAERVAVHRRSWAPARIREMPGRTDDAKSPSPCGDESSYSAGKHRAVQASPLYRADLDLVAVASCGEFAAYALGWLDSATGSVLFEPVGTDPRHARRGLGRAVCAEILRVARDLGATQAVVGLRGDDGYPVPLRLYAGLGMREVAQFVPLATSA